MKIRVIQWATGHVGIHALRGIINKPELELVGLYVNSPNKIGKDAGEIAGTSLTGIVGTNDRDDLLRLDADVVCYTAASDFRMADCVKDFCDILRTGKSIVTSSFVTLINPYAYVPEIAAEIEKACFDGRSSFLCAGIDPGFAPDMLPIILSTMSERIDVIHQQTIWAYETYDQPETLREFMGFGLPIGTSVPLLSPGAITMTWGPSVRTIAEALNVKLDSVVEFHEQAEATEDFEIPTGIIKKGTAGGLRFQVAGIVNGQKRIILEHIARLHPSIAPNWPHGNGPGTYRILISGSPNLRCELDFGLNGEDHNIGAMTAAAMCCVNSIPMIATAKPGIKRWIDFNVFTGQGGLHSIT